MLPVVAPTPAAPDSLLQTLLNVSLTGVILFRPVFGADPATVVDLAYVQLNPAAQRMLQLPECPTETFLTLYPSAVETGIFAFYRDTFGAGTAGRYDVNYQHDGLDNYYQLAAQRHGELLVVSFADTADQPRTAVEVALREAQAAERAARAEAERERATLQTLFAQAPVGFALFQGVEHVVALANAPVCAMLGHPAEQLLGRPLLEGVPELRGQGFEELLAEVARTGVPFVGTEIAAELRQPHGPLETRYFNFVYQPVRDAAGGLLGIADVVIDVTEQVLARRQLEQLNQELEARVFERTQALRHAQAESVAAAQHLQRVTESLPSTSFTVDATGQVRYISPQWYAYTGMAPGTPINKEWPTLLHPDDLPAIAREYGAALAEGRPWRYEFRLRGAAGQYRWFTSQGQPEPLAEAEKAGRVRQWFGTNLDIDDLKQAQHELEQQDRRLREILLQSPAMIGVVTGPDHRFAFTNPGYDALVGHRARLGVPVAECLPELVAQGFLALLDGVYRTGEPYVGHETPIEFQPPGGPAAVHYLDFTYQPLRDAHGRPTGVQAFVLDVTERVHARQQNEALQAQVLAAAQRLAQERATLYQVFEEAPALICILRGPEHRYDYFNAAYQRQFPRQLAGRPLAEALPEAATQGFIALLDTVYRTGEIYFGQELLLTIEATADAPARADYYNLTYQAYRENGQIVGLCVFAYVVTAQVEARRQNEVLQAQVLAVAEQRVQERETFYQVFEQTPALVALLRTPDHRYEYVNPAYQALFPGRQLVGLDVAVAVPEVQKQGFVALLDRVYQTGETHYGTDTPFAAAPAAGQPARPAYYNFTFQAYREAGQMAGLSIFAYDVTGQVRARQERDAQQQQLRAVFEQAPVAITVLRGPELIVESANAAICALWGRSPANVLGRPYFEAVPDTAGQGFEEILAGVLQTGEPYLIHEMPVVLDRAHTGQPPVGIFNFVFQPLFNPADPAAPMGIVAVGTEVTEQVHARQQVLDTNQALSAANQQLTRTNADLDTFVYTASHDLKAPITNIEGLLTALGEHLPEAARLAEPVPHLFQLMQGAVERFQLTIDQLSDITKLQQAQQQPAEAVDLAALVEAVRLDLAPLLAAAGARIAVAVADCSTVRFAPKNLRSIVYNLLSNAVKYGHPDRPPVVQVRCRPGTPGTVVLEVEDNGLGLSESQQAKLFGLFQRLHTHVEGSGIGLYMVKKIIENAGGTITVHSQPGLGTTFAVTFPG